MTCLDVGWTCGGVAHSQNSCKYVNALPIAPTENGDIMQSWHCFLGSESCFTAVQEESATLPHAQIHHCMWSVLPGLPRISTASNKHSGEKGWVWGYLINTKKICSTLLPPSLTVQEVEIDREYEDEEIQWSPEPEGCGISPVTPRCLVMMRVWVFFQSSVENLAITQLCVLSVDSTFTAGENQVACSSSSAKNFLISMTHSCWM